MKSPTIQLLILFLFCSINGCSKEKAPEIDPVITTDLSVSSSINLIVWANDDDLLQKIDAAVSYNYGAARESEIETSLTFNQDFTEVTASIDFKTAYQSKYEDTNSSNNSVTITLEKEADPSNAVILSADGPGGTYSLIKSVLAPGYNPIETPDCAHPAFGDHIDEVYDDELEANVFRFFIHTNEDNDRCIKFDRQRNEIKTYGHSPDNLLGVQNETVVYKWKFKLPDGFQSSPNFTHIHQLKSVGGDLESMPMYTLTTRKGSPDRLELRYAETDDQDTLKQTDLAPLIGEWLEVTETIKYGSSGTYEIQIQKVSDSTVLFEYSNNNIINWRSGAEFVRPKWGIYRSLINAQDLRDETVLFANFSIEEL